MCLIAAPVASASHPRPKSATPVSIKLVPAFEECLGTATTTHGAPLSLPACDPPIQSSSYLTINAPDRAAPFNTASNGTGALAFKVTCLGSINPPVENGDGAPCNANAGDQEDIRVSSTFGDIRCVGVGGQGSCAGTGGSLYNGKILLDTPLRVTDHFNATTGQSCAGTTSCTGTFDYNGWPMGIQCTSGACNTVTSIDSVVPGLVLELKRAVVETGAFQVQDAGLNGNLVAAAAPTSGVCPPACAQDDAATTFMTQGTFAP